MSPEDHVGLTSQPNVAQDPAPATREASPSASAEIGFAEHALSTDLEHVIALVSLNPELAAQSLPSLATMADRFSDFVGALQERAA